jgi:sugar lactone lactonase YvrE
MRLLWDAQCLLGEGPFWSERENCLYFVDIKGRQLLRWRGGQDGDRFSLARETGTVVPCVDGSFLAAQTGGFARIELAPWREVAVGPAVDEPVGNRFNDGKCDAAGRLWIASMDDACRHPTGAIWCLQPDGAVRRHADEFIVGNGFGWSLDGKTMYFTDSENRRVLAYTFDLDRGVLGDCRCFAVVPEHAGYPDGLAVDDENHVWSAHWDGGCVTRYRPDGSIERVIGLPVPRPTSLAFGGPSRSTLFVTSARMGLDETQLAAAPLSGGLFALDTGFSGSFPNLFGQERRR